MSALYADQLNGVVRLSDLAQLSVAARTGLFGDGVEHGSIAGSDRRCGWFSCSALRPRRSVGDGGPPAVGGGVSCGRLSLPEFLAGLVQVGDGSAVGRRLTECAVAGGVGAGLAASGGRGAVDVGMFLGRLFPGSRLDDLGALT